MEKMTYVSVLDKVIAGEVLTAEEVEKVKALREQTAKRHSTKSGKPTKAQKEAMAFAETVFDAMEVGTKYQCKELADKLSVTTQKIVGAMGKLDGRVKKEVVKGVSLYSVAEAVETEDADE